MMFTLFPDTRRDLAADSLAGLSVGDALGAQALKPSGSVPGNRATDLLGGDVDTTAATAGGVVAAYTGTAGIPAGWLAAREPLPNWVATSAEG